MNECIDLHYTLQAGRVLLRAGRCGSVGRVQGRPEVWGTDHVSRSLPIAILVRDGGVLAWRNIHRPVSEFH